MRGGLARIGERVRDRVAINKIWPGNVRPHFVIGEVAVFTRLIMAAVNTHDHRRNGVFRLQRAAVKILVAGEDMPDADVPAGVTRRRIIDAAPAPGLGRAIGGAVFIFVLVMSVANAARPDRTSCGAPATGTALPLLRCTFRLASVLLQLNVGER